MISSIEKVTIFACSPGGVLVFDHPTAGVQFPAGTVELGEPHNLAAMRELEEETGVVVDAVELWSQAESQPVDLCYTLVDVQTHDGTTIPRGYRVELLGHADPQEFVRTEYDYNVDPPRVLSRRDGLAPSSAFTSRVTRSFFVAATPYKEPWQWIGDDGNVV